jgi:hypothetical protein
LSKEVRWQAAELFGEVSQRGEQSDLQHGEQSDETQSYDGDGGLGLEDLETNGDVSGPEDLEDSEDVEDLETIDGAGDSSSEEEMVKGAHPKVVVSAKKVKVSHPKKVVGKVDPGPFVLLQNETELAKFKNDYFNNQNAKSYRGKLVWRTAMEKLEVGEGGGYVNVLPGGALFIPKTDVFIYCRCAVRLDKGEELFTVTGFSGNSAYHQGWCVVLVKERAITAQLAAVERVRLAPDVLTVASDAEFARANALSTNKDIAALHSGALAGKLQPSSTPTTPVFEKRKSNPPPTLSPTGTPRGGRRSSNRGNKKTNNPDNGDESDEGPGKGASFDVGTFKQAVSTAAAAGVTLVNAQMAKAVKDTAEATAREMQATVASYFDKRPQGTTTNSAAGQELLEEQRAAHLATQQREDSIRSAHHKREDKLRKETSRRAARSDMHAQEERRRHADTQHRNSSQMYQLAAQAISAAQSIPRGSKKRRRQQPENPPTALGARLPNVIIQELDSSLDLDLLALYVPKKQREEFFKTITKLGDRTTVAKAVFERQASNRQNGGVLKASSSSGGSSSGDEGDDEGDEEGE